MGSLADHYDGGFLTAGWHEVEVTGSRVFDYNSGNEGVEFEVTSADGLKSKASFVLTDKSLWRLAGFARACGLTKDACKKYIPTNKASHRMLHGKKVRVLVEKEDRYHKVTDFASMAAPAPQPETKREAEQRTIQEATQDDANEMPPVTEEAAVPTGEEIPF